MGSGITRCTPPVGRRSDDAGCGDHGTVTGQRFWRTRRPIYCSAVQGAIPHATRPKRTDLIQRDALAIRPYAPPEPCPEHPGGKVVRRGVYVSAKHTHQRYGCTAPDWYEGAKRSEDPLHAEHPFTPVLPRAHVEGHDACPHRAPSCAPSSEVTRSWLASTRPIGRPGSTGQPTTPWTGTRTSLSSKECQTPWPSPLPRPGLARRRCSH